ncbi:MAG: folylpolyglutamate synthase/dihydrofolate synthase family protein [Flavipsychrobacter sp.]
MDIASAYQQTLDYLYQQLPMFSRQGAVAIKKDLTNTIKLCEALGDPHQKFKSIHVAGTNGKGSVSHMLTSVLQKSGRKTGLYTSPHLIDFRERIRVNGKSVSKEWVVDFVAKHKDIIEKIEPSFFEITVAMAFTYFAEQEVDMAVIETGLGGRLDSTNIITPIASIITNISYDHMDMLGDTLEKIAIEKAGIMKQGVPVIIGEQQEETERVFFEQSLQKQAILFHADTMWDLVKTKSTPGLQYYKAINRATQEMHDLASDLPGSYQSKNIKTVLGVLEVLNTMKLLEIDKDTIFNALSNVKGSTGLRGRWDVLQHNPYIIAESAHNQAGIEGAMQQWAGIEATNKHILIGFVKDKDINGALAALPKDQNYYFCAAQIPRALAAEELHNKAKELGLQGKAYTTIEEALTDIKSTMQDDDALLITGSFFVVGEALAHLLPEGDL